MNQPIQFREIGAIDWTLGTLIDGLNGNLAIQIGDGKTYLTMDRNGTTRASSTIGAWEGNWKLDPSLPVLRITPNIVTYVIEIREA